MLCFGDCRFLIGSTHLSIELSPLPRKVAGAGFGAVVFGCHYRISYWTFSPAT